MLVLLSFGLVLVATVLLVLGLLADTLPLIYLSILLSGVAAVVLVLAVRAGRPVGPTAPIEPEREPEPEYAAAGSISKSTATMAAVEAPPRPAVAVGAEARGHGEPGPGVAPADAVDQGDAGGEWLAADQEWGEPDADWEDDDLAFPIADYDDLDAGEILPLVPQLYPDEIDVVEARELAGRARAEVLGALADARARLGPAAAPVLSAVPPPAEEEVAPIDVAPAVPSPAAPGPEPDAGPEPVVAVPSEPTPAAPEPAAPEPVAAGPAPAGPAPAPEEFEPVGETPAGHTSGLAVVDYDDMPVSDIVAALDGLDAEQLAQVRDYEAANRARRTIIFNVTRRLSAVGLPAPATAPSAAVVAAPAPVAAQPAASAAFPIDGYDALPVSDIVAALDGLDAEQLAQVRDYEAANRARRTIIFNVTRRLSAHESG
ncbi:MAG: hypothetical protein ACT4PW_05045 [Acidimicrobiia bacterium]